jgi:hypothetical protein
VQPGGELSEMLPATDAGVDRARAIEELDRCVVDGPPVHVVAWPVPRRVRADLSARQVARLLVLPPGARPPVTGDLLEDWVRLPACAADVHARLTRLRRDAREYGRRPVVSDDGRLLYGDSWIALSPRRERIAAILVGHFRELVRVEDLLGPDPPSAGSVDTLRGALRGLRQALRPLGLEIDTIPARGYTLRAARRSTA